MLEEKLCVICGTDVSGKPRFKDSKGRYACKECAVRNGFDPASRALGDTAVDTEAILDEPAPKLKEESGIGMRSKGAAVKASPVAPPGRELCPKCKTIMPQGELVCPACGYSIALGESVENLAVIEIHERPPLGLRILEGLPNLYLSPTRKFIGWLLLFGGLFSIGTTNLTTFYFYCGAVAIFFIVLYYKTVMIAFAERKPGWGAAGAVGVAIPPLALSMFWYGLVKTRRKNYVAAWAALLFALAGVGVLYLMFHPGTLSARDNTPAAAAPAKAPAKAPS